jgi:hypothetical protein
VRLQAALLRVFFHILHAGFIGPVERVVAPLQVHVPVAEVFPFGRRGEGVVLRGGVVHG